MKALTFCLSTIFSIMATAIMSYIAMATPLGPWIAPTIVLFALLFFKCARYTGSAYTTGITLTTVAASVGGIVATACGFSFPTLYFLDKSLFNTWLSNPFFFCGIMAALCVSAGAFGLWIADIFEHKLINEEKLPFPIGELIFEMIEAHNQIKKSLELLVGFLGTTVFCVIQDGVWALKSLIPKVITLLPATHISFIRIPALRLDLMPLLWSIGFVTGHVIAIPLAVGALSKIIVVDPINTLFFPAIVSGEFVLAFCSGMVLAGALLGFMDAPKILHQSFKKIFGSEKKPGHAIQFFERNFLMEAALVIAIACAFLTYFKFSLLQQAYVLIFTFVCAYQIVVIAGKIGLAQLGRFATFVMVPALFLFKLDNVQIVLIATFVEIAGGVAADVLFGRKVGVLAGVTSKKIKRYQYFGLIISSLCVGVVFWLLINHFGLGSPDLLAQRSQLRQLLIHAQSFNVVVLCLGAIFGMALKFVKLNPLLVLSGLLMPLNTSLGLIIGGLLTYVCKQKEEWYPFWSGVFAANSLWMLLKTIL